MAGLLQVAVFLVIAWGYGLKFSLIGYLAALPALALAGIMLGALGLFLSARIRQLENFAGVMNFVIFPMFFLSTALYPLWKMQESSPLLATLCEINPFTHAVELIRFAMYGQIAWAELGWTSLALIVFFLGALWGYEPARTRPGS